MPPPSPAPAGLTCLNEAAAGRPKPLPQLPDKLPATQRIEKIDVAGGARQHVERRGPAPQLCECLMRVEAVAKFQCVLKFSACSAGHCPWFVRAPWYGFADKVGGPGERPSNAGFPMVPHLIASHVDGGDSTCLRPSEPARCVTPSRAARACSPPASAALRSHRSLAARPRPAVDARRMHCATNPRPRPPIRSAQGGRA